MKAFPLRRPRSRARSLGAVLAFSFLFAQTALALHHHELRVPERKASVSRHDESGDGVDCLICALTAHVQAASGGLPALVVDSTASTRVHVRARAAAGAPTAPRPSGRAPPSA